MSDHEPVFCGPHIISDQASDHVSIHSLDGVFVR